MNRCDKCGGYGAQWATSGQCAVCYPDPSRLPIPRRLHVRLMTAERVFGGDVVPQIADALAEVRDIFAYGTDDQKQILSDALSAIHKAIRPPRRRLD